MLPRWRRRIRSNRTLLPTLVGGIFYQTWICVLTRSLTDPVTFGWLDWCDSDWWICIPKRCWLSCWCWSWFWWKHHKLGDGWGYEKKLLFSSPMSYYVHSFDISDCRRLFEALQCCTIAICCNFAHLRCEGDTRVVEEAIVLKGKVAPAENKNKIV